jgi:hypothetical protein
MAVALNQLGQVSLSVDDVDAAEEFYGQKLGIRQATHWRLCKKHQRATSRPVAHEAKVKVDQFTKDLDSCLARE